MTELLNDSQWQLPTFELYEFAPRRTDYCVCIPIINEGERIRRELADLMQHKIADHADILILDGGSTDGSTAHDYLRSQNVRTLLVKTGKGKLSAQLRMGYAYALRQGYEGIVTIDGNDKDNVDAIPAFIQTMREGWDMVQGSRFVPGGKAINTPLSRMVAIKLIHAPLISFGARFPYTDTTNGYRGYSRRLLLDPRVQPFRDVFETYELLAYMSVRAPQLKFKTKEIPVTRAYPPSGKTPTKIKGFKGNAKLIGILLDVVRGKYNP
ncbi:MAG: glycosyltransferase family 2 protein [Anaerolinea sp.]|nr:glycosyltransferase family 2 protein [Anaerolinea sp.]